MLTNRSSYVIPSAVLVQTVAGRRGTANMRAMGVAVAMAVAASAGMARADGPVATVLLPAQPATAMAFRLKPVVAPTSPTFRLNDPDSMLRTGYAGLFDLFPFQGGKFHLSGGSRLFSRTGRWRPTEPESLRYLQPFRAGSLRTSRKFRPAMLVGYGRTVDQGFSLGIDAGFVKGKIGATPDRLGRLNRNRLEPMGRGRGPAMNEVVRFTALYRF